MKSTARWIGNYQSIVDNGRKHSVLVDLPPDNDGDDLGPTALELAVMGFSGCISTIFIKIANKMRLEIDDLKVQVKAEKPDYAPTVNSADAVIKVKTDASEKKLEKCLENTLKTCPVGKIFEQAGIELGHKIEKIN